MIVIFNLFFEFIPLGFVSLNMKTSMLFKSVLIIGTGSLLATGCVTRERTVYRQPPPPAYVATPAPAQQVIVSEAPPQEVVVTEAPPAIIVERPPHRPGPDFVWIGGAWAWHGRWVWEHGRWDRPPHPGAVWRPHRYEYHNGVHVFISGGWSN
jgi:hypothetical protein